MSKNDKIRSRAGMVIAAALLASSGAVAQQPTTTLVLEGGTMIDGTGKAPVTDPVIVVVNGKITAVGKKGQVRIPSGAKIIKTDGRTILPGFIDSHTHTQDWHIPMFLHYGITTFQDKNNDPAWILAEREALAKGIVNGPRMVASGATIHGREFGESFNTPDVNTPEETHAYAEKWRAAGFDSFNTNQFVSDEQRHALVEVADEHDIPVMGHVRNIKKAASLGYKYAEHMFSIMSAVTDPDDKTKLGMQNVVPPEQIVDPEKFKPLIDYLISLDVTVNPTLVGQWSGSAPRGKALAAEEQRLAKDPQMAFVPLPIRNQWAAGADRPKPGYANVARFLKEFLAAGGHVSIGTDSSNHTIPGLSLHYEMQMMVDCGATPMQALEAVTLWNAHLIRHDKEIGSIEPGKLGDFTIIEGDPLKDIANTMNIRMVIKQGKVMDFSYDPKWVNAVPAPFSTTLVKDPTITKVSPAIVRKDGQTVTLEITGTDWNERTAGFSPNSIVRFDTMDLPTTFVSTTKLTAVLDAKLLHRDPGLYALYVVTPGVQGSVSPTAYEVIDTAESPVTVLPQPYYVYSGTSVSYGVTDNEPARFIGPYPRSLPQGSKTVTLDIKGDKFSPNSIVRFENADLPTKFISPKEVTAVLDTKYMQKPVGSYVMYVLSPGVYGKVSEAGYFQVALKGSTPQPALP